MGIGDLVKNIRASIGVPKGTVGLITNKQKSAIAGKYDDESYYVYEIQWLGRRMSHSRRLEMDLEVIG
tara:strand:+ start:807 stop:1010 length:204 start_codon:yes stop_codon:yes gene_type:complete